MNRTTPEAPPLPLSPRDRKFFTPPLISRNHVFNCSSVCFAVFIFPKRSGRKVFLRRDPAGNCSNQTKTQTFTRDQRIRLMVVHCECRRKDARPIQPEAGLILPGLFAWTTGRTSLSKSASPQPQVEGQKNSNSRTAQMRPLATLSQL